MCGTPGCLKPAPVPGVGAQQSFDGELTVDLSDNDVPVLWFFGPSTTSRSPFCTPAWFIDSPLVRRKKVAAGLLMQ
ncbi:hypothetical protein ACTMQE_24420 [Escherichia coli]